MKVWTVVACTAAVAVLAIGCDATARYKVLTIFFDGVPPPQAPEAPAGTAEAVPVSAHEPRQVGYRGHGPYAARLCSACHESAASRTLVLPREQLCFKCHDLRLTKKYIHGPIASGGCTVCHDPHGSQYRYLLVSQSDTFCLHCHERAAVDKVSAHAGHEAEQCTACHDPHQSDKKYLLR